ncbi:uncharacterized protein LOC133192057 [Saccostrea echinata]|uniref:uncharacterized protein LOC133192057 n=1 Tax=Saccostrea echinata TaxID=191078 RepID=UPI002A7FC8DB|nr:uncharacterized protein LOC133192057 [Saccostrea echinata]
MFVFPKNKKSTSYKGINLRNIILLICSISVIILTLVFVDFLQKKIHLKKIPKEIYIEKLNIKGCNHIEVEDVWITSLPKLLTESAFRLLDVNQDGILDIAFGFATGVDGYFIPRIVCDIYFNGTYPCFGGMIALDGRNGKELWRHYSDHELFGINCNADLNLDGVNDCLGGGRSGVFVAVNGRTGDLLWKFENENVRNRIMNLYTAHIIDDLNGDSVVDILAIHGGDPLSKPGSQHRLSGRIIFFCGKSGKVLSWSGVPDEKESYYSPQVLTRTDGTKLVMFGTGGETHGGGLWIIKINDLFYHRLEKAICIFSDNEKGVMTPPVLLDVNGDGEEEIIMSMFNSIVTAFDGKTFSQLWNFSFPSSESYNTPAPGFYNSDDTPDFLVKFAHGPGFPVYYYSETTILDGRSGKSLLSSPILDTIGAQSSPLTISMDGYGNDIYLYWISDCEKHEGQEEAFEFVKGTNIHEQSRSDFCRLRFNSEGFSKLLAKNQHIASHGIPIYYSGDRKLIEHRHWVNTTRESIHYIETHPNVYETFLKNTETKRKKNRTKQKKMTNYAKNYKDLNPVGEAFNSSMDNNSIKWNKFQKDKFLKYMQKYHESQEKENNENIGTNYVIDPYSKHTNKKRHVGPHDNDGIQRLLSTGTLAPTMLSPSHPMYNHSIDIVFATYWFFPAKTQAILPEDQKCIMQKMKEEKSRFDSKGKYFGLDHDGYEQVITKECIKKSGHNLPDDETYESQSTYNPYNVHMGQMTIYRLRLIMSCKECNPTEKCSRVLPFEKQQWTSYMGNAGDSHWKSRDEK